MTTWVASSSQKTKVRDAKTGKSTGPVTEHKIFFTLAESSWPGDANCEWVRIEHNGSVHWAQEVTLLDIPLVPDRIISGWSIMRGLVRAPSFHGNSHKHFFPWVMLPSLDSPAAHDIYSLASELAERYNVPLGPFEQAMAPTLINPWHHRNLVGLSHTIKES